MVERNVNINIALTVIIRKRKKKDRTKKKKKKRYLLQKFLQLKLFFLFFCSVSCQNYLCASFLPLSHHLKCVWKSEKKKKETAMTKTSEVFFFFFLGQPNFHFLHILFSPTNSYLQKSKKQLGTKETSPLALVRLSFLGNDHCIFICKIL